VVISGQPKQSLILGERQAKSFYVVRIEEIRFVVTRWHENLRMLS
jgi:hypothetical protein